MWISGKSHVAQFSDLLKDSVLSWSVHEHGDRAEWYRKEYNCLRNRTWNGW